MLHLITHAVTHALEESLIMLPFLFGAYLLIEWLEHKASHHMHAALGGRFGVIGGALAGCVPQCGFSVAAANLYAGRVISLGTLLAVFISTSDEAIPILLSHPGSLGVMAQLIAVKLVLAVAAGLLVDFLFKKRLVPAEGPIAETGPVHDHVCGHCHCSSRGIFASALYHTVSIYLFILAVMVLMNLLIESIGEESLGALLMSGSILQPAVAGLVGLIPNCAASVVLTELFLEGTVSFGAAVAGLTTSVGVGFVVLFRANRHLGENLRILAFLYLLGVACGTVIQLLF